MKESRMDRDDVRIAREEIAHCLDTPMRYWLWLGPWDDEEDEVTLALSRSYEDYDYVPVDERIAHGLCPVCRVIAVYRQSVARGLSPMPHASPRGLCRGVRIAGLTLAGPSLRARARFANRES